jgi:hypothetical protein
MGTPPFPLLPPVQLQGYGLARRRLSSLALAGYTPENAGRLMSDLRTQVLPLDADLFDQTEYGTKCRIRGTLTGPNGRVLRVLTIWMKEDATGEPKFVTFPDKL